MLEVLDQGASMVSFWLFSHGGERERERARERERGREYERKKVLVSLLMKKIIAQCAHSHDIITTYLPYKVPIFEY